MAKTKSDPRKEMREAKATIKEIMQRNLAAISDSIVEQVVANLHALPASKRFDATKGISPAGVNDYKAELLEALAVLAGVALARVRKEVPAAKRVKLSAGGSEDELLLGEFDKLPPDIRNRILRQNQLLVGSQIADIEKTVFFQFNSSVDSTDSIEQIQADLFDASEDYVTGASIEAGSGATAAQTINEVRSAFFFEADVLEEIDAFEFVNGDPVSPICQDLAGTIFAKDDPNLGRYTPPLHWNCKSWIRPILKGDLGKREIETLAPSKKELDKYVQFSEGTACDCDILHL